MVGDKALLWPRLLKCEADDHSSKVVVTKTKNSICLNKKRVRVIVDECFAPRALARTAWGEPQHKEKLMVSGWTPSRIVRITQLKIICKRENSTRFHHSSHILEGAAMWVHIRTIDRF